MDSLNDSINPIPRGLPRGSSLILIFSLFKLFSRFLLSGIFRFSHWLDKINGLEVDLFDGFFLS